MTRAESVTDQRRCTFGRAFYEVGKGRLPVSKSAQCRFESDWG